MPSIDGLDFIGLLREARINSRSGRLKLFDKHCEFRSPMMREKSGRFSEHIRSARSRAFAPLPGA